MSNLYEEISEEEERETQKFYRVNEEREKSILIKSYISGKLYKEAIEIALNYPNNRFILSQLATCYYELKMYEESISVCEMYPEDNILQYQLIKCCLALKRYEKIIEVGVHFPTNKKIQTQVIKSYFMLRKDEEALEVCNRFLDDTIIQSQAIRHYLFIKNYKKVFEIGNRFLDDRIIQTTVIKAFIATKRHIEAIEIGKKFLDDEIIQEILIRYYFDNGYYKEATKVVLKYPNNNRIQYFYRVFKDKIDENLRMEEKNVPINEDAIQILNKIKNCDISYESLSILIKNYSTIQKIVFKCAYLENKNEEIKYEFIMLIENMINKIPVPKIELDILVECIQILKNKDNESFDNIVYLSLLDEALNINISSKAIQKIRYCKLE